MSLFSKKYLSLIKGPLAGLNLTRILSEDEFEIKQVKDSLLPFVEMKEVQSVFERVDCVIDVGFGGGFPILPLAEKYNNKKFLGFEARDKKVKAVSFIAKEMNLVNVEVYHERMENIEIDVNALVTFKAVTTIKNCLSMIKASQNVWALFYKGPSLKESEIGYIDIAGWRLVKEKVVTIEGNVRHFVLYKNVPRRTKQKLKKNLVKVSSLSFN